MPDPQPETTGPRRPPGADRAAEDPSAPHSTQARCLEWCPICRSADVLRAGASPELLDSLAVAQREALLTLRTLIDAYLARADAPGPTESTPVEDIPIN